MAFIPPQPKVWDIEFFGGPMDGRTGQTNRDVWYINRSYLPGEPVRYAVYVRDRHRMIYQGDVMAEDMA